MAINVVSQLQEQFAKINKNFEQSQSLVKKLDVIFDKFNKDIEKTLKDTTKLTDVLGKNDSQYKKLVKEYESLNRVLGKNKLDIGQVTKLHEALTKDLDAEAISASEAAAGMDKLTKAAQGSMSKMEKLTGSFGKLKGISSSVGAVLGGIGVGLSFEKIAQSASNFGKILFQLKQSAAATGQDFGKFKETIADLSKTTGLSEQSVGKLFLSFQKGIRGTLPSIGVMGNIIKSINDMSLSEEEAAEHTKDLIDIRNADADAIKILTEQYKDKGAIDAYAQTLVQQGLISQQAADSFTNLADTMRDGKNSFDSEPTTKLANAMKLMEEAGKQLEKTLGDRLAPAIEKVAGWITELIGWIGKLPDWAIWGAAGVAAFVAIAAVVAPLIAAIATVGSVIGAVGVGIGVVASALVGVGVGLGLIGGTAKGAAAETEKMAKAAEATKKALAGGTGPTGGGATQALTAEQQRQKTIEQQGREYADQITKLENIRKKDEAIVGAETVRYENLLKYNNDIEGALKSNDAIKIALEEQLGAQKKVLAAAEAMLKLDPKNRGALQNQAESLQAIAELEGKIKETQMARVNVYEEQKSLADANIGAAEAELQLSQQLYLGVGPTIDAQMKVVDLYEKKLQLVEMEIEAARRLVAEQPKNLEAQKRLAQLQGEKNSLVAKELQTTKNLREGYLDAMGAFTNVEGSFAKVILRREQGMGNILRQFGGPGGAKAGMLGEGLNAPVARRVAGTGQLQYAGQGAMDKLYDKAGYNNPLNRTHIGGAQAAQAAGATDAMLAGGQGGVATTGAATGRTGAEGATASIAGTGQSQRLVDTANGQMSAIEQLNKDMPKNVADGIKMAGGMGGVNPETLIEQKSLKVEEKQLKEAEKSVKIEEKQLKEGQKQADTVGEAIKPPAETSQQESDFSKKEQEVVDTVAKIQKQIDSTKIGGRDMTDVGIGGGRRRAGGGGGRAGGYEIIAGGGGGIGRGGPAGPSAFQKRLQAMQAKEKATDNAQGAAIQARAKLESAWSLFGAKKDDSGKPIRDEAGQIQRDFSFTDKSGKSLTRAEDIMKANDTGELYKKDKDGNVTSAKDLKSQIDQRKADYDQMKNLEKIAKNTEQTNQILNKTQDNSMAMANGGSTMPEYSGLIQSGGNVGHVLEAKAASMFGLAEGGTVPGIGAGDTVPAMLTPGETVMTKDASKKFGPFFRALNKNHYALGGIVGPSPSMGGGGGGMPNINLNVRGDSVNKIMQATMNQLSTHLNRMMQPHGQTGRLFELSQ